METHTEHGAGMWTTPQCPFVIEYAPRVLDDIRRDRDASYARLTGLPPAESLR